MTHVTVQTITDVMFDWAPANLAAPWDTVGLQVGSFKKKVQKIGIALDADNTLLDALEKEKFDLVIVHHPIFYKPIKTLNYDDEMGKIIQAFIKNESSLLAFHTNLDAAKDGVNDCFVEKFGFNPQEGKSMSDGFGKWFVQTRNVEDLVAVMPGKRVGDQHKKQAHRIGFCCGSGHGLLSAAKQLELDCFITGELTYHDMVSCEMHGIAAITVGHRESEVLVLPRIQEKLKQRFPDITSVCVEKSS